MRMRSFIFPLLACGAGAYFGYNLEIGDHGLTARADLERRKEVLEGELAGLDEVKTRLERDVAAPKVDRAKLASDLRAFTDRLPFVDHRIGDRFKRKGLK